MQSSILFRFDTFCASLIPSSILEVVQCTEVLNGTDNNKIFFSTYKISQCIDNNNIKIFCKSHLNRANTAQWLFVIQALLILHHES